MFDFSCFFFIFNLLKLTDVINSVFFFHYLFYLILYFWVSETSDTGFSGMFLIPFFIHIHIHLNHFAFFTTIG